MDDDVAGPVRLTDVPPEFATELASLWLKVSLAGGSVGLALDPNRAEVDAAARSNAAEARAGRARLITLRHDGNLVGIVKLEPGIDTVVRHRGMLKLLMVDPDLQGHGWGTRLMESCIDLARELGIEQLYLSARSGTGLGEYYSRRGWQEVGRYPGGVRVAPGDDRDEVWFLRRLAAPPS